MPYLVMEFVDRDFEIVDTEEEAEKLANYYQEGMEEYAKDNREWPLGSRVIIAKLTEDRSLLYDDESKFYEMVVDKFEEVKV
jgi:hypothetical protein